LIVYAHYSNTYKELNYSTYIGEIVTVSFGKNTGSNKGSYGLGLEFVYDPAYSQSEAVPHVAGIFAKLKILTGKSWNEIRTALRETTNQRGWNKYNGYGMVNYMRAYGKLMPGTIPKPRLEFVPKNKALINK